LFKGLKLFAILKLTTENQKKNAVFGWRFFLVGGFWGIIISTQIMQ
jgi:hypothetical protein